MKKVENQWPRNAGSLKLSWFVCFFFFGGGGRTIEVFVKYIARSAFKKINL